MSANPHIIDQLIAQLAALPGINRKSAKRVVYHLLKGKPSQRQPLVELIRSLDQALRTVGHCASCNTLSTTELCPLCCDPERQQRSQLVVVADPSDVSLLEQLGAHDGRYYVLDGLVSTAAKTDIEQAGVSKLLKKVIAEGVSEVILALPNNIDGNTTSEIILSYCQSLNVKASRLAQGIPMGASLESIAGTTIIQAFMGRK